MRAPARILFSALVSVGSVPSSARRARSCTLIFGNVPGGLRCVGHALTDRGAARK
jgi:hypothetical protein